MGRLSRAAVFAGAASCASSPPKTHTDQTIEQPPPPPPDDGQHFAQPPPPTTTTVIEGVVMIDGTHAPIPNAQVLVTDAHGKQLASVSTDDQGYYRVDVGHGGMYTIQAAAPNMGGNPRIAPPPSTHQLDVADGKTVRDDIIMTRPPQVVPERGACCKPYGAPPARRRVV